MSARNRHSEFGTTISNEELNALPLSSFEGDIQLITDHRKLQNAVSELGDHEIIGFDTETRPSFTKGQRYSVSLLQMAIPKKVFLIRLNHTGLTDDLKSLLENDEILKAGVGIRDDIKALQKLNNFNPNGFVELATIARNTGIEVESVKKLAGLVLGFRISKSAQTSNWEAAHFSDKQLSYAATDAWVCLELYRQLMKSI
ncbi:MAG TPA: 3'-5' exonuclease [Cyclobacteriaceae bacterium]|nr:3'-5' exonuclease [Cyclobacteriaceae bacterium]HRW99147.1 3'-5' exonuclease [Cyclobacteriaceae bacterium]